MFPGWPAWAIAVVVIVTLAAVIIAAYSIRQMGQ